ncbi:ABC transporter ATP-binding protein [Limosilactobacillus mucosae]|jgi:branched-chain amino acid transport system ATP-binding protein|uniref:ABC transporter ATP-binding protein n=3 Tax=Bacillota TaxID=1239 RepID=A0A7L9VST1_LIMMU|nr:ABC transporter ATP-binding protein [Limosilactobacillus mucosae]MDD6453877.1 ABC transporter ATP-binding protein [Lactobacillus sp.]MDO5013211.1 ABC transporter ATP-binding protein [Lactobacillaceae bacterium]MDC2827010.1 ABC transporter ATP-binding protein [Limosilactobacillus mucosae]MDC2834588.1 ABC transporter ATP-binding protein [Limosilactobacillus mucosae]MDC2842551.1 ABC transporter ATP-binding protein [Limosilactobacillus mucosae]
MPMLQVKDLSISYGAIQAVRHVDFEVKKGEIVTLIGANGAGKSTILKTISGIVKPQSGSIEYQNESLIGKKAPQIVAAGISQVPEGRHVFPAMTVMENLQLGSYLQKNRDQIDQRLQEIFEMFPILKERQHQDAATLSGGEQQMLVMARAMMANPELLLLDEPSMGLAPIYIQKVFDIIQKINAQGTTILLIEQNAHQALSIADRGYVIASGEIQLSGSGQTLLNDPKVKRAYLGESA